MIRRELGIFLFVGMVTVLVDFASYRVLSKFEILSVDLAKATGFLVGTLFAYVANRFVTFGHRLPVPGSAWRFAILYTSTLGANVLINSLALKSLENDAAGIQLAFLVATVVSACLNFLGMKFFVFKATQSPELQ